MKKAIYQTPARMILIAGPYQYSKWFDTLNDARPVKRFLYQGGVSLGRVDDIKNICKCWKIMEQIVWECEVCKFYQEKNYGYEHYEFIAQKWAFSQSDRCFIGKIPNSIRNRIHV